MQQNGWNFLLDFISKYPKREKTFNLINLLNRLKESKEENKLPENHKHKSFVKFIEKPEETIRKYPILQRIIHIKDEFRDFNKKFIDFSRLYHMMKGRIHVEQQKIKYKLNKLVHFKPTNIRSRMSSTLFLTNNDAASSLCSKTKNMDDQIEEIFNQMTSSEESSIDSKQRKYKALDRQSSFEFDTYYSKHLKIPGSNSKLKSKKSKKSKNKDKKEKKEKKEKNKNKNNMTVNEVSNDSCTVSTVSNEQLFLKNESKQDKFKTENRPKPKRITIQSPFRTRMMLERSYCTNNLEQLLCQKSISMQNMLNDFDSLK